MKIKIKNPKGFGAGLIFLSFGLLALFTARHYPMGAAMRMGPGYFPTILGSALSVLGAIVIALSFQVKGESIEPLAWRPLILLSLAFGLYGWGVDSMGFLPALFVLVVVSAASGKRFQWREVLIMALLMVTGAWALFIRLLELPFPLFWWR